MLDLGTYNSSPYNILDRLYFLCWEPFKWLFQFSVFPRKLRPVLLRLFGSKVGYNVIIKPRVTIKDPRLLQIEFNSWIGENVWIDNHDFVVIGNNVCISQGCYLLCGSHDFNKSTFDLLTKPIRIGNGSWLTANVTLLPGTNVGNSVMIFPGITVKGEILANSKIKK